MPRAKEQTGQSGGQKALERRSTIKLVESNRQISSGSALDRYWRSNGFDDLSSKIVPHANRAEKLAAIVNFENMIDQFSMYGVGFGNWVNQEDRYNYQTALYYSLSDLQRVMLFPKENLGLFQSLAVTFGARGIPKALAHYEPHNDLINISRYEDGDQPKARRFLNSGGMGSFAHEYGHFLDFWFGNVIEKMPGKSSLTNAMSIQGIKYQREYTSKTPLRKAMEEIMIAVIFKDYEKKQLSQYYKYLQLNYGVKVSGGYFLRHSEIFARLFETHVFYELKSMDRANAFLAKTKYDRAVYLSAKDYEKIRPLINQLILQMRAALKKITK